MRFVALTEPTGAPVWINVESVLRFAGANDARTPDGTMIWLLDGTQLVKENPTDVLTKLTSP